MRSNAGWPYRSPTLPPPRARPLTSRQGTPREGAGHGAKPRGPHPLSARTVAIREYLTTGAREVKALGDVCKRLVVRGDLARKRQGPRTGVGEVGRLARRHRDVPHGAARI